LKKLRKSEIIEKGINVCAVGVPGKGSSHMQEVLILDFGGQYNQLIARRVRECNVYCEVKPYNMPVRKFGPRTPSASSSPAAPTAFTPQALPRWIRRSSRWACPFWASATAASCWRTIWAEKFLPPLKPAREYGKTETFFDTDCTLFKGLPAQGISWMSHGDYMEKVPEGFALTAHSDACPNVASATRSAAFTACSITRR
jgi:GMP synthase (glutamine-hydrolysing)